MDDFISEPLKPVGDKFDLAAMSRGEPGLPAAFEWRGETYQVRVILEKWKTSSPEGGSPTREVYLRRHYYRLRMSDGLVWVVYFTRQSLTPKRTGTAAKQRWFLYSTDDPTAEAGAGTPTD